MPEPYYLSIDELRDDAAIPDGMSDADATALIVDAEDVIDAHLGVRPTDPATGRRVVETDPLVLPWQWEKLQRATLKTAILLNETPALARGRQWQTERGPDFTFSGPTGDSVLGDDIAALLDQSLLRVSDQLIL